MPLHYLAWQKALGAWNCRFEEELFYSWGGRPTAEIVARLNQSQGLNMPVETVTVEKENHYYDLLPQLQSYSARCWNILKSNTGIFRLRWFPGGRRESVTKSLRLLNLLDRFDTLVCAEDYSKGKPDPEAFLLAAETVGSRAGRLPGI